MSQFLQDSQSSVSTFAPVAAYRLKYYEPQSLFDRVLYMLIRPPRFVYNQKLLIPGRKQNCKFDYQVHEIPFPLSIYWCEKPKYIILYLHGNSSSRFEGFLHLKELPEGASLACFDFNACGLRREDKYITLGKKQSLEVDKAVQYLQKYGYPIVGWGRSMGAVSLLMSKKCDIMIADSPFSSLQQLCKEVSLHFLPSCLCCLFYCVFPCVFCCVRSGVQKKSGMDPNQLQVIKIVQNYPLNKNLLIMSGTEDQVINCSHSQKLFDSFKGKNKRIILFEGTHNSNRPKEVLWECFNFIDSALENLEKQQNTRLSFKNTIRNDLLENPIQMDSPNKVLKIQKLKPNILYEILSGGKPRVNLKNEKNFIYNIADEISQECLTIQPKVTESTEFGKMKSPIQLKSIKIKSSQQLILGQSCKKNDNLESMNVSNVCVPSIHSYSNNEPNDKEQNSRGQRHDKNQNISNSRRNQPYKKHSESLNGSSLDNYSFRQISQINELRASKISNSNNEERIQEYNQTPCKENMKNDERKSKISQFADKGSTKSNKNIEPKVGQHKKQPEQFENSNKMEQCPALDLIAVKANHSSNIRQQMESAGQQSLLSNPNQGLELLQNIRQSQQQHECNKKNGKIQQQKHLVVEEM